MKMKPVFYVCCLVFLFACKGKRKDSAAGQETRTSGSMKILVDESVAPIVQQQIDIFSLDYPNAHIIPVVRPEEKLLPAFLNDTIRVIVLPRLLTKEEEKYYQQRNIRINSSRFAVDGIALITNKDNTDSTITVKELVDALQGKASNKKFVFDNVYSSTFQYLKTLAKVSQLPASGVFAKENSDQVIHLVSKNKDYIGILGVNWLSDRNLKMKDALSTVKLMGVKNFPGKVGDDQFYKPTQNNLISGNYPLLRNVNIIDCEGTDGLGTGFAVWLRSQRGQLVVLKSNLAPHKMMPRVLNYEK
ncbi:phosphate transport system substrate-binding protein [Pedobacter sp. UYP30]|uniref:PstS family phosphate ABC transporter substrate-binding protein n=1 Tax=Pedobacter sp. UYP30 TaxID=1756400 RepID=UPI003393035A